MPPKIPGSGAEPQQPAHPAPLRRRVHPHALRHRQRTWLGWSTITYSLRIDEDEAGHPLFDIVEKTAELGEETLISSPDPADAAAWIVEHLQEMSGIRHR